MKRAKKNKPSVTVDFNPKSNTFNLELPGGHLLTIDGPFSLVEVLRGHGVQGLVYQHPDREPVTSTSLHQFEEHLAGGF